MSSTIAPSEVREQMLSTKKPFASASEISEWLGCDKAQVSNRLKRVREAGDLVCVTKEGWAVGYNSEARASEYLGPMMEHIGCEYYIAGQSAARLMGAHTHSLTKWTVCVSKQQRNRRIGSNYIHFVHRPLIHLYPTQHKLMVYPNYGIRSHKISTPEVTIFDAVYLGVSDLVANVVGKMLLECGENKSNPDRPDMLDPIKLKQSACLYPVSVRQRSGYLIQYMISWLNEWIEQPLDLLPLLSTIPQHAPPTNLFKSASNETSTQNEVDLTWNVIINGQLDPDI